VNFGNAFKRSVLSAAHVAPLVRGHGNFSHKACGIALKAGADPECVVRMRLGYDIRLDLRSFEQCNAATSRQYDDANVRVIRQLVRGGGCALDVGANVGLYAIPVALKVPVFAFEPDQRNFARLTENIELNPQIAPNIHAFNIGLSSASREVGMWDHAFPTNCGIVEDARGNLARVEPLDSFWTETLRIDAIKMDIEGHDAEFLKGAQNALARHRPVMQMEISRWYYERRSEDFDSLIPALLPPRYLVFQAPRVKSSISLRHRLGKAVQRESLRGHEGEAYFVPDERRAEFLSAFDRE
jgi:FkbM family methyltransferase